MPKCDFNKVVSMPKCDFNKVFPCRSVISIKLLCDIVEIILWHGCSPVNLRHIFRAPYYKNTSARLLHRVKL